MRRSTWNRDRDEARFRQDVASGDVWVRRIADRLAITGLWADVHVPDVAIRGAFDDRRSFRDDGDLFLNGHRVEVRSLGSAFRTPATYPYSTIHVELAKVYADKRNAVAYLFISRRTGVVLAICGGDLGRLSIKPAVWNPTRGVARDWLIAPRAVLREWDETVTYLAERCSAPIERTPCRK